MKQTYALQCTISRPAKQNEIIMIGTLKNQRKLKTVSGTFDLPKADPAFITAILNSKKLQKQLIIKLGANEGLSFTKVENLEITKLSPEHVAELNAM